MKLSASVLPYTLMISALIGGLLGILSLSNFFASQLLNRHHGIMRSQANLASGLAWFMVGNWEIGDSICRPLEHMIADSISLSSEYWGLWGLVHAKAFHKQYTASQSLLIGQKVMGGDSPGLWPMKPNAPLSLAGNSQIRGAIGCRLRELRYSKSGPIAFTGTPLQESQFKGRLLIPGSPLEVLPAVKERTWTQNPGGKKTAFRSELLEGEFSNAWHRPVLWIHAPSNLLLDKVQLTGKILVDCPGEIQITGEAALNHVLLFARKINIAPGFSGSIQAFATEEIRVDSGAILAFPSILAVTGEQEIGGSMYLEGSSRIEGAILLHQADNASRNYSYIGPESIIRGLIWIEGNLDFRGKLQGRLVATHMETRLPGRSYQNHLLNAQIDGHWPAVSFPLPLIFSQRAYEPAFSLDSLIP